MINDVSGKDSVEEYRDSIWDIVQKQGDDSESTPNVNTRNTPDITYSNSEFETFSQETTVLESEKVAVEERVQLIGFEIADEYYGIDILTVQEIIRLQEITTVPRSQKHIKGVANLRGRVIPIISLREKFFIPEIEITKTNRIIITNIKIGTVGFIVDKVTEVIHLPTRLIESPPETSPDINSEYIKGMGKLDDRLIILLDLDKVLTKQA